MFSCRSRSAEFQMTSFLGEAEQRKFTVYCAKLRNFKSQIVLRAKAELRDVKSKLLYGSGTAKRQAY